MGHYSKLERLRVVVGDHVRDFELTVLLWHHEVVEIVEVVVVVVIYYGWRHLAASCRLIRQIWASQIR
jgi:hypothetical protein